jgi:hypothetical protein
VKQDDKTQAPTNGLNGAIAQETDSVARIDEGFL